MTRTFVKSSWSTGNGGECVEWAVTRTGVHVRDSKDLVGPELFLTFAEWDDLISAAADGTAHSWVLRTDHGVRLTGRGGALSFTPAEWNAFVLAARAGECRIPLEAAG